MIREVFSCTPRCIIPPFPVPNNIARPYVSITGITTEEEVMEIASREEREDSHVLQYGIAFSEEEIPGQPKRYVGQHAIAPLARAMKEAGTVAALHYNPTKRLPTDPARIILALREAYEENACRVLQLNTNMPDNRALHVVKNVLPELHIITPIGPELLEYTPETVAKTIAICHEAIDAVLLDASCGTGRDIDVPRMLRYAEALRSRVPSIHMGFAGGFSATNTPERVIAIAKGLGTADFSIDAEGKLRTREDELIRNEAILYNRNAQNAFNRVMKT